MKQIRIGTFETNSSSTHTLVIVSKKEFEKWKSGELLLDDEKLKTKEQVEKDHSESIKKWHDGDIEELISEERMTYSDFFDRDMETFEQVHKTPSGDEIVAFGYYGYDG
jgi:hypothetical protein